MLRGQAGIPLGFLPGGVVILGLMVILLLSGPATEYLIWPSKPSSGVIAMFKSQPKGNHIIDPVCGMAVDGISDAPRSVSGGKTYYFCADRCRRTFEADPGKYAGAGTGKPKGFWGRYLEKLNKATGGKPPSCCQ